LKKKILVLTALILFSGLVSSVAPTVILSQPNGSQVIGASQSISFTVSDADNDQLGLSIYYSSTAGDFNYLVADLNLNNPGSHAGLSCVSSIWIVPVPCTFDWNTYRQGVSTTDSSLQLFMPLDNYNFRDFAGSNSGTGQNFDKTSSSGVIAGKHNNAMAFDGTDDYISIADNDSLELLATDYTIELWAKRTATGATHVLLDKRVDADNGFVLQFNSSDQIEAQICNSGCVTVTSTSTITDTKWHYLVIEFDRSGNGQLYLDGSTDGAAVDISSKSASINTAVATRIGARAYGSLSDVLEGALDEVRVYNKLLGAAEISARHQWIAAADNNRIPDGNYFLDLNVYDVGDLNDVDSSDSSFAVDNNNPSASDDVPLTRQIVPFTVTITCNDFSDVGQASGCDYVMYKLGAAGWKPGSAVAINADGNHSLQYYPVDKAGNIGSIVQSYASLLLTGHSFNFGLKFDGNWWDSSVHIPGFVTDQNMQDTLSQTMSQGTSFDYLSFSLNNLLIGIVSTGHVFQADITNSYASTFNSYLQQSFRAAVNEEFLLVLTQGDYRKFEAQADVVRSGQFFDRPQAAFGVDTTSEYILSIGLDYYDSNIDLNGNFHLGSGTHQLVLTNQGTSGGKVVIGISRN